MTASLLPRIEGGTGADRELDALVWALATDREVREDGRTIFAKSRKPPHDECVLGWIDPGEKSRNFYSTSAFPAYTSSLDDALATGKTVVLLSGQSDGRFGEMKIAAFRRARSALTSKAST